MVTPELARGFRERGWCLVPGLFTPAEVHYYTEHFMFLHAARAESLGWEEMDAEDPDPLKRFPRMGMMHRWDDVSRDWLLDPRLNRILRGLLAREPYAVQTMMYYKPPGARGQALHQDQYYLQVQPGTCVAAWLALDDCDAANGCLQVVPGTHETPVLCPIEADAAESFTDVTVPLPEGMTPMDVTMRAGDVLFFNGQLVHGSLPNRTPDRFRRSLIAHYIVGEAEQVAQFYHPVLRMDGSQIELDVNRDGGPCGTWVDSEPPAVTLTGHVEVYKSTSAA